MNMGSLLSRALITWVLFVPVAVLNGIIRETTYKPRVADLAAHQISTVTAIIAFLILSYFMWNHYVSNASTSQLLLIGLLMTVMTILFEFGFGHYIDHVSWDRLLNDYNILKGRVWILILITELFTPLLIKKVVEMIN
jgi:hypothetical protein